MGSLILYAVLLVSQTRPESNSGVLAGRLTSIQGEPVAGVRVVALQTSYPRMDIVSQAETNRDGRYRLENVPAGEYFIVADQFSSPSYYPGTGNRDDSKTVSVTAGVTVNDLDFKFVRNSGILKVDRTPSQGAPRFSGVVRDPYGNGLPNITIALSNSETTARFWAVTDASGSFEFPALTAGEYSMETFSPRDHETLKLAMTIRAGESLEEEMGLRRMGNWQQRPDLYARGDSREWAEMARTSGPGAPVFWRCQKSELQVQPQYPQTARDANIKGSVTLQVRVDSDGKLLWMRAVSADANPDFARAAVQAVSQWRFTPLKWTRDSFGRNTVNCDGDGEVVPFQGTVTFNFPPD